MDIGKKVQDLLKLKEAGYTLTEIKDMKNRDTVVELISGGVDRADIPDYIALLQEEKENDPPPDDPEEKKDETDYKTMYENLKKEMQKKNRNDPLPGGEKRSAEQIIEELAQSIMN